MHLLVLNILVEQLVSKFKGVCSVAKSTQQRTVCYVTSYYICAAKLKYFSHFFFLCVCVQHKSMDTAIAFSLLL